MPLKSELENRIASYELFLDSAIVFHGFADYFREYDVLIDEPAAKSDEQESYIVQRFLFRLTQCVEAHSESVLSDRAWVTSLDDRFIDFEVWERAGQPGGYGWFVNGEIVYTNILEWPDVPAYIRDAFE